MTTVTRRRTPTPYDGTSGECSTCHDPDVPLFAMIDTKVTTGIPVCQPHCVLSEQLAVKHGVHITVRYLPKTKTVTRRRR
jgi:hypothetical protein